MTSQNPSPRNPGSVIRASSPRPGEAARQDAGDPPDPLLHPALREQALREKLAAVLAENAGLRAAQAAIKVRNDQLRTEWSAAVLALQVAQAHVREIEQSTIWRVSRPLRVMLHDAPMQARLLLRGGISLLRWAALRRHALRPPAPRHLAFLPATGQGSDTLTADRNGRYALVRKPPGYVYVPPRRPGNLEEILAALSLRPRFSIVVPVCAAPPGLPGRMLASVRAQWYPDWELILAGDPSPALTGGDDARIKVTQCPDTLGISTATNAAIAQASGDYIVLLGQADELTPDCLYELARCIAQQDADYLYSDEDGIDRQGGFARPFFKPDWSPDTLMSTPYTGHVSCIRRSLLQAVGLLRPEFDGAEAWDLILRVTERADRIAHIPKVLYHQRIAAGSADPSPKPQAEAGRRAREAALIRRALEGRLEPVPQAPGQFRICYAPRGMPRISIIIPSRDNGEVLRQCIESLQRVSLWQNFEILVIDNGSVDPATIRLLRGFADRPDVRVIRHDVPFNWSELNNFGAREAAGDLLLFLNDDTELLAPDGLARMAGYAQLAHIGAVGAKLLYPGTHQVQHAGVINLASGPRHAFLRAESDSPGDHLRNLLEHNWAAVTGACLMIERSKFIASGGFDEGFPVAYNDIEMGFRLLENGLFNIVCPSALWLHHESLSRGQDGEDPRKLARLLVEKQNLYLRHPQMLMHDPFYNPNLNAYGPEFDVPA